MQIKLFKRFFLAYGCWVIMTTGYDRILWICIIEIVSPASRNTTFASHQLIETLSTRHACFSPSLTMVNTPADSYLSNIFSLFSARKCCFSEQASNHVNSHREESRRLLDHTEQSTEEECDHKRGIFHQIWTTLAQFWMGSTKFLLKYIKTEWTNFSRCNDWYWLVSRYHSLVHEYLTTV